MSNLVQIRKIFNLEKGVLQSSKCTPGDYDFITAAADWKKHNNYDHECEALIIAVAASGSLGRTHYVNGKFITSDLCLILTPKDNIKYPINLSFYHFVFNSMRNEIVTATKSGTSKESINQKNLNKYELPYFNIDQQNVWINKLKNTLSIKKELLDEQCYQQALLSKLRQQILQEAIEGKLTADWRKENPDVEPASELLKRIRAEKEQLIKDKKIKKQKPLSPITEEEKPFEIPDTWEWCRLGEITYGFQYGTSSKSDEDGICPVLRMGNIQNGKISWNNLVYSNNESDIRKLKLLRGDLLFNRTNSRELVGKTALFNEDRVSIFAGYLVRFHMFVAVNSKYSNFVMNSKLHQYWCEEVKTDAIGQSNINATKLSMFRFPLPTHKEQNEIVKKIESLMSVCDDLEREINQNKTHSEQLMRAVLKEAFE